MSPRSPTFKIGTTLCSFWSFSPINTLGASVQVSRRKSIRVTIRRFEIKVDQCWSAPWLGSGVFMASFQNNKSFRKTHQGIPNHVFTEHWPRNHRHINDQIIPFIFPWGNRLAMTRRLTVIPTSFLCSVPYRHELDTP